MSNHQEETMQGRKAFTVLLGAFALGGCGSEAPVEPARIAITQEAAPQPVAPEPEAAPAGEIQTGSRRVRQTVQVPQQLPGGTALAPAPVAPAAPRRPRRPQSRRRFLAGQLAALRAHCAAQPKDDPRCIGGRVNKRVAFAAYRR